MDYSHDFDSKILPPLPPRHLENDTCQMLNNDDFNVIVMKEIPEQMDFTSCISCACDNHNKEILLVTDSNNDNIIEKVTDLGCDYYLFNELPIEKAIEIISSVSKTDNFFKSNIPPIGDAQSVYFNEDKDDNTRSIEERISSFFIDCGVPPHVSGYQYLCEAVKIVIDNPKFIKRITQVIYPTIATKFNSTSARVERSIRHAIDVTWTRGKIKNLTCNLPYCPSEDIEKPTNGEFIAIVADQIFREFIA